MSYSSGFFNSEDGDRKYNASQISNYFEGLLTNGVYQNAGGGLSVIPGSGLAVQVLDGRALIDCLWFKNESFHNISLATPSATYSRIDTIILRLNTTNREIVPAVLTGIPAPTPAPVPLTRAGAIKEYALAYVTVAANATTISSASITDKRSDSTVCGWVGLAIGGGSGGTLTKTEEIYTTTGSTTQFAIPNDNYTAGCPVLVHLGGMLLTEGSGFTVSDGKIVFPSAVTSGRAYTVIVFSIS